MRSTRLYVLAAFGSAWILAGCVAMASVAAPAPARIIVLYDAFGKDATMTKDWGYAALVEISGKTSHSQPRCVTTAAHHPRR